MGLIDRLVGGAPTVTAIGAAARGVTEVFVQNATRRMELDEEAYGHAINQMEQEFRIAPSGRFDRFINGLNRLPRPALALGTMGLFVYAMVEPEGFGLRMEGLQQVPEPLWWLLGAIVGFYFGAREAHYFRHRVWPVRKSAAAPAAQDEAAPVPPEDDFADNAALRDWAASLRG
ncbi:holin family protein [Paracoccus saliphilus]|uniref:Holin family protein n=1 Tax=Paracoccus saliphilus TaxID=405559 RepID=A0AA45W375_9RHOB|nr:holin family protein [Paracoccus saliphilus]WCR04919.1 holin family protein [Paracoccus saliphilus]SIS72614.1 Holin of 3TMs, for gene-transfer release [Paracoccus saliphilus]